MNNENDIKTYPVLLKESAEIINWIMLACSKDDSRPSLQCFHITEKYWFATDGFRIHIWKYNEFPLPTIVPGIYLPLKKINTKILLLTMQSTNNLKSPDIVVVGNTRGFMQNDKPATFTNGMKFGVNPKFYADMLKLSDKPVVNFNPPLIWKSFLYGNNECLGLIMGWNVEEGRHYGTFASTPRFSVEEWLK